MPGHRDEKPGAVLGGHSEADPKDLVKGSGVQGSAIKGAGFFSEFCGGLPDLVSGSLRASWALLLLQQQHQPQHQQQQQTTTTTTITITMTLTFHYSYYYYYYYYYYHY